MMEIIPAARVAEIAEEINQIKSHVLDTALRGAIQIGKRLHEAKALVAYGEWGRWLSENVDYSERKAQEFMALYDTYSREDEQTLGRLGSKTHAYLLSMLPREDREKLLEEYDMASISTRELEDEVHRLREENEKQQLTIDELMGMAPAVQTSEERPRATERGELEAAREEADAAKAHAKAMTRQLQDAEKELNDAREQVAALEKRRMEDDQRERAGAARAAEELKAARAATQEARQKAEAQAKQLKRMEEELEAARAQVRTVEALPEEVEAELNRLRGQAARSTAESELRAAFDGFKNAFEYLMNKLGAAEEIDPKGAEKYRTAFSKAARTMAQRME